MVDLINEWAELAFNEVNQERKKLNYFLIFDRLQIHKLIFINRNFCDCIRNTYTMKSLHSGDALGWTSVPPINGHPS